MRFWLICFFINLFVCIDCKSQSPLAARTSYKRDFFYDTSQKNSIAPAPANIKLNVNRFTNTSVKTVPAAFYYNSIGFFCKKELQVEKALKFPVKFRLGSVAYTDEMEGKGKGSH